LLEESELLWRFAIAVLVPGLSVVGAGAVNAEIYWSLKVWGIAGEEGFATRLSSSECLCTAARLLKHPVGPNVA
jgi:hypothetical protein